MGCGWWVGVHRAVQQRFVCPFLTHMFQLLAGPKWSCKRNSSDVQRTQLAIGTSWTLTDVHLWSPIEAQHICTNQFLTILITILPGSFCPQNNIVWSLIQLDAQTQWIALMFTICYSASVVSPEELFLPSKQRPRVFESLDNKFFQTKGPVHTGCRLPRRRPLANNRACIHTQAASKHLQVDLRANLYPRPNNCCFGFSGNWTFCVRFNFWAIKTRAASEQLETSLLEKKIESCERVQFWMKILITNSQTRSLFWFPCSEVKHMLVAKCE